MIIFYLSVYSNYRNLVVIVYFGFQVSPCHTSPCKNGATCTINGEDTYSCTCTEEFEGDTCESSKLSWLGNRAVVFPCIDLSKVHF